MEGVWDRGKERGKEGGREGVWNREGGRRQGVSCSKMIMRVNVYLFCGVFSRPLQMQSEAVYAVEVLLCCSTESCKGAPKAPPKPPPPGDKGEMQVRRRVSRCV